MSSRGDRQRHRQRGFTLIEIMVALAVFSLAVLALVRLESATARGAGAIDATLLAQMVAETVAVEAITDPTPPVPGRSDGRADNGGRAWNWTRSASRIGGGAMRIDVTVSDPRGQVLGRLTAVRPPQLSGIAVSG